MWFYQLPETLPADIAKFSEQIRDYRSGKINPVQFRGVRVAHGVYEQRQENTHMVRIRIAAACVTPAQLRKVAELSHQYGAEEFHVTTRQDLQLHYVDLEDVATIYKELAGVGLTIRGGGGNTVRNIMASHTSGVLPGETFDVTPYALALTTRLIAEADSWNLPRKFKIAFTNTDLDDVGVFVTCLGFVAKMRAGKKGFKVYVAGGQGAKPMAANLLFDWVPDDRVYYLARAAKLMFDQHGNRRQRAKARLKFLWGKLGPENFKRIFQEFYEQELRNRGRDLQLQAVENKAAVKPGYAPEEPFAAAGFAAWKSRHVRAQKQEGLYTVSVPLILGDIKNGDGLALADLLENFGDNCLRLTSRQNLQLRNLPATHLPNVFNALMQLDSLADKPAFFGNMIFCTGAATCKLGICLPRGAAPEIQKRLEASELDLEELSDVRVNISGCPNSCGSHHLAELGFFGRVGKQGQDMYPAYNVVAGAVMRDGEVRLAEKLGVVAAKSLPDFIHDACARYLGLKDQFSGFADYVNHGGRADLEELCAKYRAAPPYAENPDYYRDWGDPRRFTLLKGQRAECSAGMFDMIDVDLKTMRSHQEEVAAGADTEKKRAALSGLVFHAARMLLVTRGIETRTEAEVFDNFTRHFIEAGLVPRSFAGLVAAAKEKDLAALAGLAEEAFKLADHMSRLYASMDDSLRFNLSPVKEDRAGAAPAAAGDTQTQPEEKKETKAAVRAPDMAKDFRGVSCPMNFVKVKLAIEPLQPGQLLEVLLDDGEAITNVPRSVKAEGHLVIEQNQAAEGHWTVVIEKR